MKRHSSTPMQLFNSRARAISLWHSAIILPLLALATVPLHAQVDGSWISTSSGNWGDAANWSSNPAIAGGADSTVAIQSNITTTTTIDLQSTDRTVGILNLGDADGTSQFTIASSDGGALIFERAGGAQLNINQGGTNEISAPVTLASNLTIDHNVGFNLVLSGAISGAGSITKNGTGRVYTPVANTFSGGFTLNSGTFAWLSASALGSGPVTWNGGTLETAGSATTLSDVNLGGTLTKAGAAILTLSGTPMLTANTQLTTAGRLDVSGALGGDFSLTKDGAGLLNLYSSAKTYSGGFTLNQGTVLAQVASAFGASTATVRFNSGVVSPGGGNLVYANPVEIGTSIQFGDAVFGTGNMQFNNSLTLVDNATITTLSRASFGGTVSGAFSITKEGSNVLNFYGASQTYSGGFTLNNGLFAAQSATAFGSGTARLNNGTLTPGGASRTYANTVELAGTITFGDVNWFSGSPAVYGNMTFSGPISIEAPTTLNTTEYSAVTFSGSISGSEDIVKTGSNSLTLTGAPGSFTGAIDANAGTLRLFRNGGPLPATAEVRVSGGTLEVVAHNNQTIGDLVMSSGQITISGGASILPGASFNFTNSGTVGARLAGATAPLTKTGAGTVSLNHPEGSTYGGGTVVSAGTLLVNNTSDSGTGSGTVTVAAGAVLGGTGRITGATTISGSLQPGNSIGTLTVNNDVTWNAGDDWVFELGTAGVDMTSPGTSDLLNITGGGSDFLKGTGSGWTFDFAGTGEEGWYKLVDWAGTTTFASGDFSATNLSPGLFGNFVVDGTTSALYLEVIPEPSSMALLGLGLAALALRRRRK